MSLEEGEGLLDETKEGTPAVQTPKWHSNQLCAISLLVNICLLIIYIVSGVHWNRKPLSSYERGFSSDLGPIKNEIELIEKQFSGGIHLDSAGLFVADSSGEEYVGPPSAATDEAWDRLLQGINLDLDYNEVDLTDSTFQWPESGLFFSGLEVYHSLHCLNRLRQALYPEYYGYIFNISTDPSRENHIGHCINHLRQAIQCHADLTPMEWKLDHSRIILKTDTYHTCRNFDKIHAWATLRRSQVENIKSLNNGSLVIVD